MHVITLSSWALFRLVFTTEEHCGYDLPWHFNKVIPFSVSSEHHSFHHEKNIGNYSQFFELWDNVFGTQSAYQDLKNNQAKKQNTLKAKTE